MSAPESVAFSPNGDFLALGYSVRPHGCPRVELLKSADGAVVVPLELSPWEDFVSSLTFSPDGAFLAAAMGSVWIWSTSTGKTVAEIQPAPFGPREEVEAMKDLAFSPDSKLIAAASRRRPAILVWNVNGRRLVHVFTSPRANASLSVPHFSAEGAYLGADGVDTKMKQSLIVWSVASGKPLSQPTGSAKFLKEQYEREDQFPYVQPLKDPWRHSYHRLASGREVLCYVSNMHWSVPSGTRGYDPHASATVRLADAKTDATIATFEIPGRAHR